MFIYCQGRITTVYGALYGNIFLCIVLFVGTIMTAFIRSDMKRQIALSIDSNREEKSEISEKLDEKYTYDNLAASTSQIVKSSNESTNDVHYF